LRTYRYWLRSFSLAQRVIYENAQIDLRSGLSDEKERNHYNFCNGNFSLVSQPKPIFRVNGFIVCLA